MTKFATTALVSIALAGATTSTAFAGGLTAPIVEPAPVVPVAAGGLDWRTGAIAAGLVGLGVLIVALSDDDDDNGGSSSTTTTTD